MPTVHLNKNRDRSVRRHHPWIFSGAIARVEGDPQSGDVVRVNDAHDSFLAWGYYNDRSQIQVRCLDWDENACIDEDWWRRRLQRAADARRGSPSLADTNACRLVYSEADGLPGLIVDRYDDCLVVQVLTAGIERIKPLVTGLLGDIFQPQHIYERSDADMRSLEGLSPVSGPLTGDVPPDLIDIHEGPYRFLVDVSGGQKTGFYTDQRDNRKAVASYARDRDVLDLFSYTGGFAVHALGAGAGHVTLVESSRPAMNLALRTIEKNQFDTNRVEATVGNAFLVARSYRDAARTFGTVICDPPKFAHTKAQLPKAERAYKDINLLAMKMLQAGGILATFSCSGGVTATDFSRIIAWAALDANRDVQILHQLGQASDHPIDPCFPESAYLKGLICRVS